MNKTLRTSTHQFEASYLEKDDKITIKASGQFIFSAVSDFREIYESFPATSHYVLDMGRVERFDSAGLGCILVMFQYVREQNRKAHLVITNASDDIQKVFEVAKISELLDGIEYHSGNVRKVA